MNRTIRTALASLPLWWLVAPPVSWPLAPVPMPQIPPAPQSLQLHRLPMRPRRLPTQPSRRGRTRRTASPKPTRRR